VSLILFNQPTAARRAFPCWDEPAIKATFAITLISRADTVNLSNMSAISEEIYKPQSSKFAEDGPVAKVLHSLAIEEDVEEWKITRFESTPLVRCSARLWVIGVDIVFFW
jgi:aminopeptidase 2